MAKLTDTKIRNLKADKREKSILDGNYLYLVIRPTGTKSWSIRYKRNNPDTGKQEQKKLTLGHYPAISLREARQLAIEAVDHYKKGIDYGEIYRNRNKKFLQRNTFKKYADEWVNTKTDVTLKTLNGIKGRLKNYILPRFGSKELDEIKPQELRIFYLEIFNVGKSTGETSKRCLGIIKEIFNYCIVINACRHNPASVLIESPLLPKKTKTNHMPTITDPDEIGILLNKIDSYNGDIRTNIALKLAPHVMLRPNEIYNAKWEYIDFEARLWTIPAEMMKARREHIIPLSNQVLALLEEIYPHTGDYIYVFPHRNDRNKTMSNNTLNSALKRLGYQGKLVPHGFRSMASTILHEQGYNTLVIEAQLAHIDKNPIRSAYNKAEYLQDRKEMLQNWSDYLDELKSLHA